MKKELPSYGGQAVIEGVMMRGSNTCAIAVRSPDQSIEIKSEDLGSLYRSSFSKMPFIRGLFILWDAMVLGIRALTFSANVQTGEDEKIEGKELAFTLLLSLTLGVVIFFLLPAGAAQLAENFLGINHIVSNLLEGIIRLALLLGYMWGIGKIDEIERVLGYHGAEHKTINAFEAGAELEVAVVRDFPREHTRCGTAFLFTVVIFSIVLFSLIGDLTLIERFVSRIVFIPLLASLAYEYIRMTSRIKSPLLLQLFSAPNLALQKLTTREPDDDMLEISIAAFKAMYEHETQEQKIKETGSNRSMETSPELS
ncbi:MAG: DUF1385 domain-containing protein [Anaerolineales bacterium]|nr:DUF1385 domain-containing protein [Anaerolineales bacterium]